MKMTTPVADYPWARELEKTVINSLATSFGLDFLLFKDKLGGDVDTVHNVRQQIWASDKEKQAYIERGDYREVSGDYHSHENYITKGRQDKEAHKEGNLHDAYSDQTLNVAEQRNLDHIIAAKEIHDDQGRVLADLDGIELANQNSNLQSTHETINKSKKQTPINDYLNKLPNLIGQHEANLTKKRQRLETMSCASPAQRHQAQELKEEIRKTEEKIEKLKSIDPEAMRNKDKQAREHYNTSINLAYYTSSKFFASATFSAAGAGLKMGTRQMLGLVMAEIWFELREQIPKALTAFRYQFSLEKFIEHIAETLKGIWHRIQIRFKDFLISFRDGVFGGVMSSVTTTIFNIFATTQKVAVKIIREVWGQLCSVIKLIFFNPEKLAFVDLCKAVAGILSASAGVVVGSLIHAELLPIFNFPFGAELVGFIGALVTGLVTLGLTYVVLHSEIATKVWGFLESNMPYAATVKDLQAMNVELDRYLIELARVEFNLDMCELKEFTSDLAACVDESQRSEVLKAEIVRRQIDLPFEMGNPESTRKWLTSLVK